MILNKRQSIVHIDYELKYPDIPRVDNFETFDIKKFIVDNLENFTKYTLSKVNPQLSGGSRHIIKEIEDSLPTMIFTTLMDALERPNINSKDFSPHDRTKYIYGSIWKILSGKVVGDLYNEIITPNFKFTSQDTEGLEYFYQLTQDSGNHFVDCDYLSRKIECGYALLSSAEAEIDARLNRLHEMIEIISPRFGKRELNVLRMRIIEELDFKEISTIYSDKKYRGNYKAVINRKLKALSSDPEIIELAIKALSREPDVTDI